METTLKLTDQTSSRDHKKVFLIGWSLTILLAWFGSLWIVTGLVGLPQDDQGGQVYVFLMGTFLLIVRPLFLFWWVRSMGFKQLPVYLPADVFYFLVTAVFSEIFWIVLLTTYIDSAYDFSFISGRFHTYTIFILFLIFRSYKSPKKTDYTWISVWVSLFALFMFLFWLGFSLSEAFSQVALDFPSPLLIFAVFGLLGSILATISIVYGFNKWFALPGWRVQHNFPKRRLDRFTIPISIALIFGLLIGLAFLSPRYNAILNGLEACGWIDQKLGRSACVGRWQSHGTNQGLLSPTGERFIEYESWSSALRVWSSQGEMLHELSLEIFPSWNGLEAFDYLEGEDLLAFAVLESGIFIRGGRFGALTALPSRSAFYTLEDMRLTLDGEALIVFAGNGITVWRIEDQQEIARLDIILVELQDVHLDADSSEIRMIFNDGTTISWDYATDEFSQVGEPIVYTEGLFETAFIGENGISYIVTAKENELLLWPSEGEIVHLVGDAALDQDLQGRLITVSPDGRTLLASGYGWMQVWRVSDGTSLLATKTCLYDWDCRLYKPLLSNTGVIARFRWDEIQIWSLLTDID